MKRTVFVWMAFGTCLAVVLTAMGWISLTALRLEREQILAERRAAIEENVRLALWRIDSTLLPFIGRESARPYESYQPFVTVPQALTSSYTQVDAPVLLPSPLLSNSSPFVLCYFQFDPDGKLTSPQVPRGEMNKVAQENNDVTESEVSAAELRLGALAEFATRDALLARLPAELPVDANGDGGGVLLTTETGGNGLATENTPPGSDPSDEAPLDNLPEQPAGPNQPPQRRQPAQPAQQIEIQKPPEQQVADVNRRGSLVGQREMAVNEYRLRARNTAIVTNNGLLLPNWGLAVEWPEVQVAALRPVWIGENLLLARRVSIDGKASVQGVWLDWPAIKTSLLTDVEDLLPAADIQPIRGEPGEEESRLLTTIPARIVPGALPRGPEESFSPIRSSLVVAWICTISAALLGAIMLSGVLSLSERRAAFVSAVTHELRTPLTTFQLYTEMLEQGLVRDEAARRDYLRTLRAESDRLGHLVENVLAYARLDRNRQPIHFEEIPLTDLIGRVTERLTRRAEQSGMQLTVDAADDGPSNEPTTQTNHRSVRAVPVDALVRVDPSAVERILVNLVDNACKYASSSANRSIELSVTGRGRQVEIRVRDFGPGTGPKAKKRLFRLFSKSAREAAGSQPGVGLGLALSRSLARKLGGELSVDAAVTDGACFLLTLPIVEAIDNDSSSV